MLQNNSKDGKERGREPERERQRSIGVREREVGVTKKDPGSKGGEGERSVAAKRGGRKGDGGE